jgi:sugar-specific transcriptional regulator TrmB
VQALEKSIASGTLNAEAQRSILNRLRGLGLATYEAQAYLALVQNPDVSATKLCNKTGVPDSKIDFALEELQKKGLVVVSEGVPRHYRALAPKEALGKLKSRITQKYEMEVERLNQLSLTLEPLYTSSEKEDVELAYIVKGFDNVLNRMIDVLESAKREVVVFVPNLQIYERVESHLNKIRKEGVKVKLAIPPKLRKQIDASRFADVRELTPNCLDSWLAIADGKTVISSSEWRTERCHAILTQDPVLAAMSREYFESPRCCVSS